MTCPPCKHDCEQGKTCPAKSKQAIAELESQEPVAHKDWCASLTQLLMSHPPKPTHCNCTHPQRTEQNFCARCGKRLGDVNHIHTCTPPYD
jgi:hypothetical protein